MANNVTTSIVVQFSSSTGSGQLSAEIDSREDGLNKGKTSFVPGDPAAFLVFKSPDVILDAVQATGGSISPAGSGSFSVVDEWVQFMDTDTASPAKYISSGLTYEWFGNNLGAVTFKGGNLVAESKGVGMLKISYIAEYEAYRLQSPSQMNGKTDFQIAALVKGHN